MSVTPEPLRFYARALLWTVYVIAPSCGIGLIHGLAARLSELGEVTYVR